MRRLGVSVKFIDHFSDAYLRVVLFFLCAYVFLIPSQYFPQNQTEPDLFVSFLRVIPSLIAFFLLFVTGAKFLISSTQVLPKEFKIFFAFVLVLCLSALCAPDSKLAFSRLFYYSITGVGVCFAVFYLLQRPRDFQYLAILFAGLATLVAIYGILEYWLDKNLLFAFVFDATRNLFYRQFTADYEVRILSTVGHPVFLATSMVIATFSFFYLIETTHRWWLKYGLGVALVLVAWAVLLTFSRSGLFGFLVSLFIYFFNKKHLFWKVGIYLGIVGALLIFMPSVRELAINRNSFQSYASEFGTGGRIYAYRVVVDVVKDFPLLGVGTAHYRVVSGRYGDIDETPDNTYLMLLVDGGLLGFSVFLFGIFIIIHQLYLLKKHGFEEQVSYPEADACLATLVGVLINMITCDALYFATTRTLFWVLVGGCIASLRLPPFVKS